MNFNGLIAINFQDSAHNDFKNMTWEIKPIGHEMTYMLRQKVLWPGSSIAEVMVEADESATHFGAFRHDRNIGVVSLFSCGSSMQFRKLAVLQEYQKMGVGTALLRQCIATAKERGADVIWCDARLNAIEFYKRLGFTIDEHEFIKSGKHYKKAIMHLQ